MKFSFRYRYSIDDVLSDVLESIETQLPKEVLQKYGKVIEKKVTEYIKNNWDKIRKKVYDYLVNNKHKVETILPEVIEEGITTIEAPFNIRKFKELYKSKSLTPDYESKGNYQGPLVEEVRIIPKITKKGVAYDLIVSTNDNNMVEYFANRLADSWIESVKGFEDPESLVPYIRAYLLKDKTQFNRKIKRLLEEILEYSEPLDDYHFGYIKEIMPEINKLVEETIKTSEKIVSRKPYAPEIHNIAAMLERISPKLKIVFIEALRKPINKLSKTDKKVLLLAKMLWNLHAVGTDISKVATHKLKSIEKWVIGSVKGDLPGLDTPEMRQLYRELKKLLKSGDYKNIEKLILEREEQVMKV